MEPVGPINAEVDPALGCVVPPLTLDDLHMPPAWLRARAHLDPVRLDAVNLQTRIVLHAVEDWATRETKIPLRFNHDNRLPYQCVCGHEVEEGDIGMQFHPGVWGVTMQEIWDEEIGCRVAQNECDRLLNLIPEGI